MSILDQYDECPLGEHVEVENNLLKPDVMGTYCMKCEYNRSNKLKHLYSHLAGTSISCSANFFKNTEVAK